ncbi:4-alpha-glucanotransferase [Pontibacter ruber]|uniref:4-alpha-glucanotransferase n=1 Tax=Pontibacter ruber TaxID=1343895 RepID=A0ABW5CZ31_9BACT|nr:4-alpha-glucanotransferase [Pontibacter ruber]
MIIPKRSSGILLHITSLPSPFGIGDLGPEAYKFADRLAEAGQRYWQILPLNPTEVGYGNSPYSSHSAFAFNPLLISPELLVEDGLLEQEDLKLPHKFSDAKVEYEPVTIFKRGLWEKVFANYRRTAPHKLSQEFEHFKKEHGAWLEDYSRYVAFKNHFADQKWTEWPDEIRNRKKQGLKQLSEELAEDIEHEQLLQFLFYRQWEQLKAYCAARDITFIGDMPFYVSHDSADVWANPKIFKLDKEGAPTAVSGVPPDYFSETGQLWGTPVFNWKALQKDNFDWWVQRIAHNLRLFGLLRLDHFRAFSAYWEVPADEETAINGKWVKTPGAELLSIIRERFPDMPIIAEDLGDIDKPVRDLMEQFDLPGMRVLLFGLGEDMAQNIYAPHLYVPNCIAYTGTHDNSTVRGWYEKDAAAGDKRRLRDYSRQEISKQNVHEVMAWLAYMSVAQLAILPVQDILGLGAEATMNKPSTSDGNWAWRLKPEQFSKQESKKLKKLVQLYGR